MALSLLCVLALLAAIYALERRGEVSPVARGEWLAEANGCYACHGRSERDPRANFRRTSSGSMRAKSVPTFWENGIEDPDVIKEWIRDGHPADEEKRHERFLIQMPAYGDRFMDESEIDAVAAWILAEGFNLTEGMGNATLAMPELPVQEVADLNASTIMTLGDRLSRQQGCYQCHGQLGQGGVSNPLAFKEYIPGFWGRDFLALTDGGKREEILHWIEHGRGKKIESGVKGRLAKRYFERQAIPMPPYKNLLSESEKAVLVEYLLLLNQKGPLTADAVEALVRSVSERALQEQETLSE